MHPVVVLEPQFVFRKGLCHLFDQQDTFRLVGDYGSFQQLENEISETQPKIILIGEYKDHERLNKCIHSVWQFSPMTEFMIFFSELDGQKIKLALDSGVKSILTKNCSREEIFTALNSLIAGNKFLCNSVLDILLNKNATPKKPIVDDNLTPREQDVVTLIAKGMSTQKISEELCLSIHTINTHRKNILKKLQIKSPVELIVYAIKKGFVK